MPTCSLGNAKNMLLSDGFLAVLYPFLVAVCIFLAWWGVLSNSTSPSVPAIIPWCAPSLLMLALFLYLLQRWRLIPEKAFYVVSIPALFLFALFILPNQVPDEAWHICRAFDLKLDGSPMVVPEVVFQLKGGLFTTYPDFYEAICVPPEWGHTVEANRDLSQYLVHLYLLPSLVIDLCQLLNLHPLVAIVVGRLANAAMFVAAGYWAIKWMPIGKTVMTVYLLNPMLIQQEASLSADAVCNIATILFVSYLLRLRFSDQVSRNQIIVVVCLFLLTCISKYIYAVLGLLFLLLVPRLPNPTARRAVYIGTGSFVLLVVLFVVFFYNGEAYYESVVLVRDFPECVKVMAKSFYEMGPLWVKEFAGMLLGALSIIIWEPCFWAYSALLLFSVVFNLGEAEGFRRGEKVFIICVTIGLTLLMILVFREWTLERDNRSDVIMGVQGRYFIPYLMLPLLCAITSRSSLYRKNVMILYGCILAAIYFVDGLFMLMVFM